MPVVDGCTNIFVRNPVRFVSINSTESFEEKIRHAEFELGISPGNNVPINYQRSSSILRVALFAGICLALYTLTKRLGVSVQISRGLENMRSITSANFKEFDKRAGKTVNITFKDVAGLTEAKVELNEFVSYLNDSTRFKVLGAKLPRGALLVGPPGCGKTLLAKALSSEASVPFLSIAGSEFIEVVGGLGAARVRDLFKEARKRSPCIIYIDELDAIGKKRSSANSPLYGSGEHDQTLNQLLVEMDGLESASNTIVVIASSNRPDVLDRALLRPGRFDRHILVDIPTKQERQDIIELHISSIRTDPAVDLIALVTDLAAQTVGMTGADLSNLCNEAALLAALRKSAFVCKHDFSNALDKIQYGLAKKSTTMSLREKKVQALHESGHVIVAWDTNRCSTLKKVSIIERIGHQAQFKGTRFIPTDATIVGQNELIDNMVIALGGRAAEHIILNSISSGSEDDISAVTKCAYDQIKLFGMSQNVGPIAFSADEAFATKPYSRKMQLLIDDEARKIVSDAYSRASSIICKNRNRVTQLAEMLFKRETIYEAELKSFLSKL